MKRKCFAQNKPQKMKLITVKHRMAIAAAIICTAAVHAQNKQGETIATSQNFGNNNNQRLSFETDSSTNPPVTIVYYKDGRKVYNFTVANNQVTEMYVNGHQLPADSFYVYNDMVEKVTAQMEEDKNKLKELAQAREDQKAALRVQREALKDKQQALKARLQAQKDELQAVKGRQQALKGQLQAAKEQERVEKTLKAIITDIVAEHIAPGETGITQIKLSDDEFAVNGTRQSQKLLAMFKAKYLKKPNTIFQYTNTQNSHSVSVTAK